MNKKETDDQELGNRIYEAMAYAKAAFYTHNNDDLDRWQGTLQALIKGMSKKRVYKLADSADAHFREQVDKNYSAIMREG